MSKRQYYGGGRKRRACVKLTNGGICIGWYPSLSEAARQNYMSYQTVKNRCERIVEKEFAEGWTFRYEEDWIRERGL